VNIHPPPNHYSRRWILRGAASLLAGSAGLALGCNGAPEPSSVPAAPSTGSPLPALNVVLVVIDTLRADHLGCYGYPRRTTPFIDELAASGVLFETARSNTSYTNEAVSLLLSGMLPTYSGNGAGWYAVPAADTTNLAAQFSNAGYRTGFFANTVVLDDPAFKVGFDEAAVVQRSLGLSRQGPLLSNRAVEFVQQRPADPFFLYVHYLDPHAPYRPPARLLTQFTARPDPRPLHLYNDVRPHLDELRAGGFGPGEARFDEMVARYDGEIAHSDEALEVLLRGLERLGALDNTLVVVTADHGEEFLEHGFIEHAWTLYEESLRVPMILWAPGLLSPRRESQPVSWIDLFPTLLALAGIDHDRDNLGGSAWFQRQGDALQFVPPAGPLIAETLIQERCVLRAAYAGDHKYIASYKWLDPTQRQSVALRWRQIQQEHRTGAQRPVAMWAPPVREELYDLSADPGETTNVLGQAPEAQAATIQILADYRERCEAERTTWTRSGGGELTPEMRQMLKELGYINE